MAQSLICFFHSFALTYQILDKSGFFPKKAKVIFFIYDELFDANPSFRREKVVYNRAMIIIVGPSASGKTEVAKILKKDYDIKKAITHTTRAPRQGERNGVDYYFVNEETFELLKKSNAFVETTTYDGNHYGCSKAEVSENKCVVLDPNGLKTFKKLKNDLIVSFQLMAAPTTREARMRLRGDKEGDIYMRIMKDQYSFASKKLSGYVDFKIKTDKKTPQQIAEEIYALYLEALRSRGMKPTNK